MTDTGSLLVQMPLHLFDVSDACDFPHVHPKTKVRSLHSQAVQCMEELGSGL